jgi:hypothetical protein
MNSRWLLVIDELAFDGPAFDGPELDGPELDGPELDGEDSRSLLMFSDEDLRFLPGFAEKDLTGWAGRPSSAQPARSPDRSILRKLYKELPGRANEDLPSGPMEDLPG